MSFPFSAQGANLRKKIYDDEKNEKLIYIDYKDIPKELQVSKLKNELAIYDFMSEDYRTELSNSMFGLSELKYMNMKYLAAALALLHIYDNSSLKPIMFELSDNNDAYKIVIKPLTKVKNINVDKVLYELLIYCEVIKKYNNTEHIDYTYIEENENEESSEEESEEEN